MADQNWIELMENLERLLSRIDISDHDKEEILDLFINYERMYPGSINITAKAVNKFKEAWKKSK